LKVHPLTISQRYSHQLNRLKPIFNRAHDALVDTIRPNAYNARLIRSARAELSQLISSNYHKSNRPRQGANGNHVGNNSSQYIGVHLRRGDRHPASYNYHGGYVPISDYVQAITDTWTRLNSEASSLQDDPSPDPVVYIAFDSPSAQAELASSLPRDTIFSLSRSKDPGLQALASTRDYVQKEFDELGEEARINATRGMVLDFAIISGMWAWDGDIFPNATVCTIRSVSSVSSLGCE